jgi:hypothetical protein
VIERLANQYPTATLVVIIAVPFLLAALADTYL